MDMPFDYQKKKIEERKQQAKQAAEKANANGSLTALLDIGGNNAAGSLAEALERQAAVQRRMSEVDASSAPGLSGGMLSQMPIEQPLPQSNPVEDLISGLFQQANSINVAPTPFEELQKLANQQVAAQFDPVIAALQQQMDTKQKRGKESQSQARGMYNSLGDDLVGQLPQITQQFAAEDAATNARYDNAQRQLQDMYGQQSQQQQQVLQNLGIQAAAPDASAQARTDQNYFQGQMESEQQAALNALAEQEMAQSNYQRNLGNSSRMAGENTAQDIGRMLEDYMDQAGTQMTGLQGQRGSALSALLQQLQGQDASRVQQEEQQQFQNLMALSNFQLDAQRLATQSEMDRMNYQLRLQEMANQQMQGQGEDPLFQGTMGNTGAANFLAQLYPDQPILASGLLSNIDDVMRNEDVVRGKYVLDPGDPGMGKGPTYADVDQNYISNLLRREIEQENIQNPGRYGPSDIANAIDALMAYLGKMR